MGECRRTAEQLTPYLDGLLSPAEHADVERHLGGCPPCRRAAAEASGGRTLLRERGTPLRETLRDTPLPPGLRSRCEALAATHGAHASWWRRRLVPALTIAVLILGTGLAVFSMETRRSDYLLAQQLTLDHMKCFYLFASPDSSPLDAHDAESWLATKYGWDLHLPPSSAAAGISLIGARRCVYASGTIPHVMYRVNGQNVSLFMLQGVTRRAVDLTTLGYESRIWSRGATTFVLIAPQAGHIGATAARYVMEQMH
jgi:anti-sigma factor RsiW